MHWESLGEGVEMCHDNPYKSSRYQNLVVIPIDALMTMKWLGLPWLYALINEALNPT